MKIRVTTAFNDRQNGYVTRPVNEVFECSESRAKDLIKLGYVKEAVEEVSAEEKPKPKRKLTKHI